MRFSGDHRFEVPRDELWQALHDPDVLARALPGCESFAVRDEGTYAGTLTLGVAGAKGTYRGKVEEVEARAPDTYRLLVTAAGAPGEIEARATVHLEEDGDATRVRFEVEASLNGEAAAMGGRLLAAAADRTAATFMDELERVLAEDAAVEGVEDASAAAAEGSTGGAVESAVGVAVGVGEPDGGDAGTGRGARLKRALAPVGLAALGVAVTVLVRRLLAR